LAKLNYLLFPRWGDWAVLQIDPSRPATEPLTEKVLRAGYLMSIGNSKSNSDALVRANRRGSPPYNLRRSRMNPMSSDSLSRRHRGGKSHTIPLAKKMLRDPNFVAGTVHTKYVEQNML